MTTISKQKRLMVDGIEVGTKAESIEEDWGGEESEEQVSDVGFEGVSVKYKAANIKAKVLVTPQIRAQASDLWRNGQPREVQVIYADGGGFVIPLAYQKLTFAPNSDGTADIEFVGAGEKIDP